MLQWCFTSLRFGMHAIFLHEAQAMSSWVQHVRHAVRQCFSKRIPGLSLPGKIDMFCFVELCLTCAVGLYILRSSILRISLPSLCSRQFAADSGGLGGLAAAKISFGIVIHVLSCWRCLCVGIHASGVHVFRAGHGLAGRVCSMLPKSVSADMYVLACRNATSFLRERAP